MQIYACKILALALLLSMPAVAQQSHATRAVHPQDPVGRMAEQRQALGKLTYLDGVWRGPARHVMPEGRSMKSPRPSVSAPCWVGASS